MKNSVQIQNKNNNLLKFMRMLLRESTAAVTIKERAESRMQYEQKITLVRTIAPSSIFSIAIVVLLVLNGLLVASSGYNLYDRQFALGFLGIANIVLLAVAARSNASAAAKNDQSSKSYECDRFFTLSPDMLCVIGFDGDIKRINPAAETILGYSPAEMVGQFFIKFVHPDDRETTLKEAESIAAGKNTVGFENRWRCRNGSYKWIAWTASPFCEEELMYGIGREITDRKLAQESLQQSNSILRSVIESTPDVIFVKDIQGRYAIVNSAFAQVLEKPVEAIIGKDDTALFPPEIAERIIDTDSKIIAAGEHLNYEELVPKDGEMRTFLTAKCPWRDSEGNAIGIIGITRDISDRKAIEAALLESNILFENVIESTGDSIFVKDTQSRYLLVNSKTAGIMGLPKSEIIGKKDAELFPPEIADLLVENDRRIWQSGLEETIEEVATDSNGNILTFLSTKSPLRDRSRNIIGIVGVARDITERKITEQALAEQLKLSLFTADVGISLTQNHTLPATLQKCTDAVVRHLDAAFARIWTLNQEGNVLELQASAGIYTHIDGAHSRIAVGEFKIGLIAKERKPHITNSVQEDPRISDKEWAKREGMVAFAGYPLIVDNQLVGVVAMFARQELTESTLIALASIADSIALGIKRKQTEVALAAQKQTLRVIIDNSPIWVWMINASGRMFLVNKTFCDDVAIGEDKFLAASHYSEVLGLEASANCMASDAQAWSQDTPCYDEEVMQLADGEYHNLEIIKTHVTDDCGNAIGLIGLGLDVTKQREAQRQLQESEARFRKLAEQELLLNQLASNIRESLDLDTILATTVQQIRDLLKLDSCVFIWYYPDASPPVWDAQYEARNANLPSVLGLFPISVTGSQAEGIANLEIIRIDDFETVTDPVEREFFVSVGLQSLLSIPIQISGGKIGVISCGAYSGVRCWSDEEVELLVAVGNQLAIAISQSELYTQSVDSARIAQKQAAQIEATLWELQQAQTQLVQAEKMSSLGQMVAGIAHEINNPVSFIFGNLTYTEEYTGNLMKLLQMYRDEYPQPGQVIQQEIEALELDFLLEDLPKMLSSMQVGATRIRDIVRSLRNFSRLDESDMKNVNIHEGIDSTLMILEHRLKVQSDRPAIQVVKEYGQLPLVDCYAGQLNQVFMNIIANAIDVLQEPLENPGIIRICTEIEGAFAVIRISDNGTGITDKVKQRIFDPFYTTKPIGSGTGMGLAISHSIIVEKHKGKINCFSVVGKGTEFAIEIPIQRREN